MSKIKESFSMQWKNYKEGDRTWNQTLDEREKTLIEELDCKPEFLKGKKSIDIGCGNGTISKCFQRMGANVTGLDISDSIKDNRKRYPGIEFIQSSILDFSSTKKYDIVYAKGSLHHTGNNRAAVSKVASFVKKGGKLYIWQYSRSRGFKHSVVNVFRPEIVKLPMSIRKPLIYAMALVRYVKDRRTWRESILNSFDLMAPVRDELDPHELIEWFKEEGFTGMKITNKVPEGYGVIGTKSETPKRIFF